MSLKKSGLKIQRVESLVFLDFYVHCYATAVHKSSLHVKEAQALSAENMSLLYGTPGHGIILRSLRLDLSGPPV